VSPAEVPLIGDRIRAERLRHGLTVRGLARDVGVSASLISQIETDKSKPSVSTLYAITSALGMSLADLLDTAPQGSGAMPGDAPSSVSAAPGPVTTGMSPMVTAGLTAVLAAHGGGMPEAQGVSSGRNVTGPDRNRTVGPLITPAEREVIVLDSGVTWERLGQVPGAQVDFLLVTYQPGGTSSSNGELMRHNGSEYGYLLSGALTLRLGFDEHQLTAGDAVTFPSSTPHGYRNDGIVPAVGVWLVLDQQ
jgi:quercetin dioxygenase-like cupin family protein/DNA-binding XRE family transcriptional regulator